MSCGVVTITDTGATFEGIVKDPRSKQEAETILHFQLRLPDGYQPHDTIITCAKDPGVVQVHWDLQ